MERKRIGLAVSIWSAVVPGWLARFQGSMGRTDPDGMSQPLHFIMRLIQMSANCEVAAMASYSEVSSARVMFIYLCVRSGKK